MTSGKIKKTPSRVSFYVYLTLDGDEKVRKYASDNHMNLSQLTREALNMRMSAGDQYNAGFNAGLNEAMAITRQTKGGGMMFPSGKTFAALICDGIEQHMRGRHDRP
jgi:hypothetical protein